MGITVASRRLSIETRKVRWPHADVLDVTSKGDQPWVQFSPFYPHGGIPVPLTPGVTGQSVEGIWQALKVFENEDVDAAKLEICSMKNIKRTVRSHSRILGHRAGLFGDTLLSYDEARKLIYLPAYGWVLENRLNHLVNELFDRSRGKDVVLLDYNTNADLDDLSLPLSHAALIVRYLNDEWLSVRK